MRLQHHFLLATGLFIALATSSAFANHKVRAAEPAPGVRSILIDEYFFDDLKNRADFKKIADLLDKSEISKNVDEAIQTWRPEEREFLQEENSPLKSLDEALKERIHKLKQDDDEDDSEDLARLVRFSAEVELLYAQLHPKRAEEHFEDKAPSSQLGINGTATYNSPNGEPIHKEIGLETAPTTSDEPAGSDLRVFMNGKKSKARQTGSMPLAAK